ncbi:MAG: hypothetical protein Q9169_007121, partial [Polycauliona sp. 2 TL-2023]
MENSFSDPVLQVMEDPPNYDFGFDLAEAPPSAADSDLPFLFQQYDGTTDESPFNTTASSSPTTRFSAHQNPIPSPNRNVRKRARGSLDFANLPNENLAKSRKTTPSPGPSNSTTPASFDPFNLSEDSLPTDPDLIQSLFGNDTEDPADVLKMQREYEREFYLRKEQEENDALIARQWEERGIRTPSLSNNNSASQSFLDSKGRVQRHQHPSVLQSPFDFSSSPLQLNAPLSSLTIPKREKTEVDRSPHAPVAQSSAAPSRQPYPEGPNHIINLDSDEEDNYEEELNRPVKNESQISNQNMPATYPTSQWTNGNSARTNFDLFAGDPFAGGPFAGDPFAEMPGSSNTGINGNSMNSQSNASFSPASRFMGLSSTMSGIGQGVGNMARGFWNTANDLVHSHNGLGSSANPFQLSSSPDRNDFPFSLPLLPNSNIMSEPGVNHEDLINRYRERYDYLTNDPTRTLAEIKDLLNNIRPDEDLPPENREGTPDAMVFPLMEHQKLGLTWLKAMEVGTTKGGILADGMGLGKTIQAIALMVSRRSTDFNCKTTLIIAPVALMKQWEREIKTKLKANNEHRLTTYTLHGQGRQATWEELKKYDVVLTTFGTLSTEVKRRASIEQAKRANPNWRPMTKADRLPLLGDDSKWYRVIIDEAQCIKNKNTKAALGASALISQTRFAMSGTPMQNNITELYSLIRFLRIKPYSDYNKFTLDFTRPMKSTYEEEKARAMQKLRALLKATLLRRDKKSTIDGKPILDLPERTTTSQHAAFSEAEQEFYNALESRTQLQFNKYVRAGTIGRNYSNVLVLLLRLRQACCHPHLIKDFSVPSSAAEATSEDLEKMARELAPDVIARIIEQGDRNDHSGLECPVCMDATENATIFVPCGHNTCSECFARISDPSQAIANGEDGEANLKCPQCRGKIVKTKLTDHVTFKKIHLQRLAAAEEVANELEGADSDSDDDTTEDEGSDLGGFIVDDDDETTEDESGYRKGKTPFERCWNPNKEKLKKEKTLKGKGKAEPKGPKKTLAQLKKESLRNMKAKKKYLARVRKTWESSAKIERTMEILKAINARKEGEKTIIFSQFTSLLDLLEVPIYDEGIKYQRYDGSMSSNARNDAVMEFTDKPDCKIMLVSLRAGNAGLNLVAASQVIIMDPFWNPYVEEQAIDRAHRIGQRRPVQVHRMLIPDTVEDRILELQKKKRVMIESALDENASKEVSRLGERELAFLF